MSACYPHQGDYSDTQAIQKGCQGTMVHQAVSLSLTPAMNKKLPLYTILSPALLHLCRLNNSITVIIDVFRAIWRKCLLE